MAPRLPVVVAVSATVAVTLFALATTFHAASTSTSLLQRVRHSATDADRVKEVATRLRQALGHATRSVSLAARRKDVDVHKIRKQALSVPATGLKGASRVTELADASATKKPLSAAEEARCVGMLHACQSWLELKDGDKNDIVITSPEDDTKELLNKHVVLPGSGQPIPDATWSILQESCKYGLSDLRQCDKPDHWPMCTGAACTGKNAKKVPSTRKSGGKKH